MSVGQKTELNRKDRKQTVIDMKPPDLPLGPIYKKVSSLCWAKLPNLPGKNTILYTTVCPIGYMPSLVYLGNLDAENNDSVSYCNFFFCSCFQVLQLQLSNILFF